MTRSRSERDSLQLNDQQKKLGFLGRQPEAPKKTTRDSLATLTSRQNEREKKARAACINRVTTKRT